ncbi:hypothetical protein C8J55DRAFT_489211 [Lentinula edodes]|uniref:Uncharacterized protein n=1 Tax=Lentinula lateritia TaxID=40482 RepID=A0A9W9DNX0_9AGAR|nr:hypothetical protein C8J55DRAFT_489211 [Lentinula edodes]
MDTPGDRMCVVLRRLAARLELRAVWRFATLGGSGVEAEEEAEGVDVEAEVRGGMDAEVEAEGIEAEAFEAGVDAEGFNVEGFNVEGFDVEGFDMKPVDVDRIEVEGVDAKPVDVEGLDVEAEEGVAREEVGAEGSDVVEGIRCGPIGRGVGEVGGSNSSISEAGVAVSLMEARMSERKSNWRLEETGVMRWLLF